MKIKTLIANFVLLAFHIVEIIMMIVECVTKQVDQEEKIYAAIVAVVLSVTLIFVVVNIIFTFKKRYIFGLNAFNMVLTSILFVISMLIFPLLGLVFALVFILCFLDFNVWKKTKREQIK